MESDQLFKLVSSSPSVASGQASPATIGSMRRLDSLFRAMATDYLLREQFVTSPSSVIFDYVYGVQLARPQAEVSDQLIYAVMSSRRLLEWLHERGFQPSGSSSRNAYASQFARGVVEHGAPQVVMAMMKSTMVGQQPVGLDEVLMAMFHDRLVAAREPVEEGGGGGGGGGDGGGGGGGDGGGGGGDGGGGGGDGGGGGGDGGGGGGDGGGDGGTGDGGTGDGGTGDGGTGDGGTGDGGTGDGGTGDGGTGSTFTAITLTTFITSITSTTTQSTSPFTHTGITRSPFTTHTTAEAALLAAFDRSYVLVSMDALFQYANGLRESGALNQAFPT